MNIFIRKFEVQDIPYKVRWINDEKNNKYLHYDLPLREDKTLEWFKKNKDRKDRIDFTIIYENQPAGLIGLLNIDSKKNDAEYYICLGGENFKGKGIANIASDLLIKYAYNEFGIKTIYLFTEVENIRAQKLFEKIGFRNKEVINNSLIYNGRNIDRYKYSLDVSKYLQNKGELK